MHFNLALILQSKPLFYCADKMHRFMMTMLSRKTPGDTTDTKKYIVSWYFRFEMPDAEKMFQ